MLFNNGVISQDTVADLRDFEDLNEILQTEVDGGHTLYVTALKLIEKNGIPYRSIRYCRVFKITLPLNLHCRGPKL